jgi:hypothetical protein
VCFTQSEEEKAVYLEALERASASLEEEREELQRTALAAARREARRADAAELMAQELSELQSVLSQQETPGPALIRLARERQEAMAQLLPTQRRVSELEEDVARLSAQVQRLRVRNAALLDRERIRSSYS